MTGYFDPKSIQFNWESFRKGPGKVKFVHWLLSVKTYEEKKEWLKDKYDRRNVKS